MIKKHNYQSWYTQQILLELIKLVRYHTEINKCHNILINTNYCRAVKFDENN